MSKTDEITVKAQSHGFQLDDKTIKQLERMIRQIDPNATISAVIARQPFTQIATGQKCVTCGFEQANNDACVMCETAGQIVLTIKRGELV